MVISGNYNTEEREINIVKTILNQEGIQYNDVLKYSKADDGDVLVKLSDDKTFLIEVKEEDYQTRFKKYGEFGIDYISAFQFKNGVPSGKWKGSPKHPTMHNEFINDIDKGASYKQGKIYYSKSNLWLFFVDKGDKIEYWFYDGIKMTSQEFKDYLIGNCMFTVNNKPVWQGSYYDNHNSACFFIKPNNLVLQKYLIDIKEYVKNV